MQADTNDTAKVKKARIGIYSGTFDPVHAGHIAFALQALERAELDMVYFLPERRPRYRQGVEHFGHRVAMLRRALKPHARLRLLEYVDISFSVQRTLPQLKRQFRGSKLVFLMGSESVQFVPDWPLSERLLRNSELVIAAQGHESVAAIQLMINHWTAQPTSALVFESFAPDVSSGVVREALRSRQSARGLLQSVARYSNRHWLYISLR